MSVGEEGERLYSTGGSEGGSQVLPGLFRPTCLTSSVFTGSSVSLIPNSRYSIFSTFRIGNKYERKNFYKK